MEILSLKEVKNYLRIDYNEDNELLQSLMVAANTYLKSAIDKYDKKKESEYYKDRIKILNCSLIQEWYDNRESYETKSLSYTIRSLITQIQMGDVE